MMALIDPRSGRVAQLAERTFPIAPPLFWVEAPRDATERHTYEDGVFLPEPEPEPEMPAFVDRRLDALLDKLVRYDVITPADSVEITPRRAVGLS